MATGKVLRAQPTRLVDGTIDTESQRRSGYGEAYVKVVDRAVYADEGSYFIATNPTLGTGVVGHAAPTTQDETKPILLFRNGAETGGKRAYLDFLKLRVTAAGTAGTLNYATMSLDNINRYTSGGSDCLGTIESVNMDSGVKTVASQLYLGAITAPAAGPERRRIFHDAVRTVIPVVGDHIVFTFGAGERPPAGVLDGTTQLERVLHVPPIILGPSDSLLLILWRASQSAAASYELQMGWWER